MNRAGRSVSGQAKAVLKHAQSRRWRAVWRAAPKVAGACGVRPLLAALGAGGAVAALPIKRR
jgi:hypothetical protein